MPVTFVVDAGNHARQTDYDRFTTYFNIVEKHKKNWLAGEDGNRKALEVMNKALVSHPNLSEKRRCYKTLNLHESMFDGQNLWLLKPSDQNRGRGVSLFNSLEQLKRLIVEITSGRSEQPREPQSGGTVMDNNDSGQDKADGLQNVLNQNIKTDVVVIQKYIERPLLI